MAAYRNILIQSDDATDSSRDIDMSKNESERSDSRLNGNGRQVQSNERLSTDSLMNYIVFCFLFSITHATVDAVVAFSTAELGAVLGSFGGFTLYIAYTLSSLLVAKPFMHSLGPKYSLFFAQIGSLCYVGSFFMALSSPSIGTPVFILGSVLGGVGAGIMWTAQGVYYNLNAKQYSRLADAEIGETINNFASIFSFLYLALETLFGAIATIVYVSMKSSKSSWKVAVFGSYTVVAVSSVTLFWLMVKPLESDEQSERSGAISQNRHHSSQESINRDEDDDDEETIDFHGSREDMIIINPWQEMFNDFSAVGRGLLSWRALQLITPYQICFGLSAGFINYYVNGFVVKPYVGDGYIGVLSAVTTVTAAMVAIPYAKLANAPTIGKWYIMIFSGLCFMLNGLLVLSIRKSVLGSWAILIPYFIIHGCARGAWESTNKAVIADYFTKDNEREIAYATVYFTSGLAGAFGYIFYKYMSGTMIATVNVAIAVLSIGCYHYSTLYRDVSQGHSSDSFSKYSESRFVETTLNDR